MGTHSSSLVMDESGDMGERSGVQVPVPQNRIPNPTRRALASQLAFALPRHPYPHPEAPGPLVFHADLRWSSLSAEEIVRHSSMCP